MKVESDEISGGNGVTSGAFEPSHEPLPSTARRCEFAGWRPLASGVWRTRIKPDIFVGGWMGANSLIISIALLRSPSAFLTMILSAVPAAFVLHALWLLYRRVRLRVKAGEWLRWEVAFGRSLAEVRLEGLLAIQLIHTTWERAADGTQSAPWEQANLVFDAPGASRREVLAEARPNSPEVAGELARELAKILRIPFLDQRGAARATDEEGPEITAP